MRLYCYKTCAFFLSSEKDLSGENTFILNSNKADKIDYTSNAKITNTTIDSTFKVLTVSFSFTSSSILKNHFIIISTYSKNTPFNAMTYGSFSDVGGTPMSIGFFSTLLHGFITHSTTEITLANTFSMTFNFGTDIRSCGTTSAYTSIKKFLVF